MMNHDDLVEGQLIHLSARLSGEAAADVEQSPIAPHQSFWKEDGAHFRVRVTVPFSRELLSRLWRYASEARVDAPYQLREILIRNLRITSAAYAARDEASFGTSGFAAFDLAVVAMRYFDDWASVRLTCPVCKWRGSADPAALKWNDSDSFPVRSFRCPRCGKSLLDIEHSVSMKDTLANIDKLDPDGRARILESMNRFAQIDASRLTGPDQLPDLDLAKGSIKLVWDIARDEEGISWNSIRQGDRVIWRQRATWEGFTEFCRVAAIIQVRYGESVHDLVPTETASMWLGGDVIGADAEVEKARRSLGWKRIP